MSTTVLGDIERKQQSLKSIRSVSISYRLSTLSRWCPKYHLPCKVVDIMASRQDVRSKGKAVYGSTDLRQTCELIFESSWQGYRTLGNSFSWNDTDCCFHRPSSRSKHPSWSWWWVHTPRQLALMLCLQLHFPQPLTNEESGRQKWTRICQNVSED